MSKTTREQFLEKAEALFSERGFYGVSIAAIAKELDLTKQALLHHFGSKEKLYGEVLKRISARLEALSPKNDNNELTPEERLKVYLLKIYFPSPNDVHQTRLLMRELLDNNPRADTAGTWYLKSFLENLIAMVKEIPNWQKTSDTEALCFVYQLLGAVNYYSISGPTLTGIFGPDMFAEVDKIFPKQLENLIDAALAARAG